MKRTNKKGFTIVELVIVIAVIAILAAVLIPTFAGIIHKANVSNDTQLVKNLNTALGADTTKNETMTDALAAAAEFGYDVEKINASATDNEILWDSANNVFCYFNDGAIEYIPESSLTVTDVKDYQYWVISDTIDEKYSTYYTGDALTGEVAITKGFDAGEVDTSAATLKYERAAGAEKQIVAIRMNGGNLTVNAPTDKVKHFGESTEANIIAVDSEECFHEYGKTEFTQIKEGKYVVENGGSTNAIVYDESKVTIVLRAVESENIPQYKVTDTTTEDEIANIKSGATDFAGGLGTEDEPYLIETAEQMQNITAYYEKGYNYFKVKDGVKTIDMTGVGKALLRGSFDGNGAKLVNLNTALFQKVGYQLEAEDVKISNLEAVLNNTDGSAFVRNVFTAGKLTFENVALHGYIEGQFNIGSFYNYGTCNYDSVGADYTVEFKNATSDISLVSTSGNGIGGLIGHGYEGAGNTLTIICDDASVYTGTMYTTTGGTCDSLMAMASNGSSFVLNGEEVSGYDAAFNYPSTKIAAAAPAEAEDGKYTVAKVTGADSAKIFITAQYDMYDAEGNKIQNNSGITAVVSTTEITDLEDTIVALDAVESVELVNEYVDGGLAYTLENGVLKVFVGPRNILSGVVRLQVAQYDVNGGILATGTVEVGRVEK